MHSFVVGEYLLQDGSTMLIEAAKGGHVNVVNLLLDWSANAAGSQTSNSPVEASQASPSQLYPLDFEQVNRRCRSHLILLIADQTWVNYNCNLIVINYSSPM